MRLTELPHRTKGADSLSASMSPDVIFSPIWNMHRHQALEEAPMVGNPKVEELMCNHKVLELLCASDQIGSQCDRTKG